ncbi:MAG: hypothetical protein JXA87_16115 [Thermoleophilia bacterium]|nr:hypothetical protein [Thermoleophilia bacterium]
MTASNFERFAVRTPIREAADPGVKGRDWPPLVYMSSRQVPETDVYVELGWIRGVPEGGPQATEQVLDYDQLLLHVGMDYKTPQVLGGTVEMYLGGQPVVFNTTTGVFIPKGTPYGPFTWKEFQRPHLQVGIVFGTGEPYAGVDRTAAGAERAGAGGVPAVAPKKTREFDFEEYVIRSPMREAGPAYVVTGRQLPSMTYLSRTQVNAANHYLEFGWIWDVPSRPLPRMRHDNYSEMVLHFGSDPDHPEDLGGTMEFGIGDDTPEFDTTYCVYVPKGLEHGPLKWKQVQGPMAELAMMLGAGVWAEGWEGSFFDES